MPRLWFVLSEHPPGLYVAADMAIYVERAGHWRAGSLSAVDTTTPPGWPALLALAQALAPSSWATLVAWAHALLGAATCALVHRVAWRLGRSEAIALAASMATALYLPLVVYEGLLLSETTSAFLVVLGAWLVLRASEQPAWRRCAAAGAALGAATLVHANLALALPLLFLFDRRIAWRVAAVALVPVVAASALASHLVGHPCGVATNGGVNFFLAHSDFAAVRFPAGDPVEGIAPRPNMLRGGDVYVATVHAWDEGAFYALGLRELAHPPWRLLLDLRNVKDGLGLGALAYWPGWMAHQTLLRAFSRAYFWLALLPAAAHALVLARRRAFVWRSARGWLWLAVLQAVAALYLFLGDPRIRVPFDPLVLALAGEAWIAAVRRVFPSWSLR
ncbi:MAG TPA: hypothetical protein VIF15_00170 [Polyangiaceae bacterium]